MSRTLIKKIGIQERLIGSPASGQITVSAGVGFYGPTFSFTPSFTANYKIWIPMSQYSSAGDFDCSIKNPSGPVPTYLRQPAILCQTVAFSGATIEAEVSLVAGTAYTFQISVNSGSGGFILFENTEFTIEQILE